MAFSAGLRIVNRFQQLWRLRAPHDYIRYHIQHNDRIDYLKLAARCNTVNMFNRLHIDLENVCAPLEIVNIRKLGKSNYPRATHEWIQHFTWWAPDLLTNPQLFQRRAISESVMLYQDLERDVRDKSLLVAFADDARRLMLPISVFLQYVDGQSWDVVVLKRSMQAHVPGWSGLATDFHGVMECVQKEVSPSQYQRVITFGTSAGGFPAIWAAILLRAHRGISICGAAPRSIPPSLQGRPAAGDVDLCYVYGSAQDERQARSMLALFGGRLRSVPEINDHVLLYHLVRRGEFGTFLGEMLA